MYGGLKEHRVILTGPIYTNFSLSQLLISGDKNVVFLLVQGGHLSHGSCISCFQKKEGSSESSSCTCCFQVTLVQNNQYAKEAEFGVMCSEPLHCFLLTAVSSRPRSL